MTTDVITFFFCVVALISIKKGMESDVNEEMTFGRSLVTQTMNYFSKYG